MTKFAGFAGAVVKLLLSRLLTLLGFSFGEGAVPCKCSVSAPAPGEEPGRLGIERT